jgi:hypothetical protein
MAKPICFMIMPFSTKETGLGPDDAGPKKIDFDALWERALGPAIEECGYLPVRADQDAGALIVVEMIQRLAMSDLVVADITIGNANVYYEIGVRHAAQQYGCVLVSADWAKVLFDIDQMPRLVYTLNEGSITEETASTIRGQIKAGLKGLAEGESPVYQAVPGFPESARDRDRVTNFKSDMEALNAILGRMKGIQRTVDEEARKNAALALRDELVAGGAMRDGLAIRLMELLRDAVGWAEMVEWIERMPERLRARPFIQEQKLLAISKAGAPMEAIGALERLIEAAGDSSERQGLLGGRYKKLFDAASPDDPQRIVYLQRAIDHYERGTKLDLNDYYPSCNLPRLYRERGAMGDKEKARIAGVIAMLACERAKALNPDDEWLRPTLLGAAFDAESVPTAQALASEVQMESPGTWKLETTISDLRRATEQASEENRAGLAAVFNQLNAMLPPDKRLADLEASAPATKPVEPSAEGSEKKKGKKKKGKKKGKKKKKKGKKKE